MKHRCYQCKCLEDESPAKYFKRMKRHDPTFFCKACIKLNPEIISKEKAPLPKKEKTVIEKPFDQTDEYKFQVEEGRNYRKMIKNGFMKNESPTNTCEAF